MLTIPRAVFDLIEEGMLIGKVGGLGRLGAGIAGGGAMGAEEVTSFLIAWERMGLVTSLFALIGPLLVVVATTPLGKLPAVIRFGLVGVMELLRLLLVVSLFSGSLGKGLNESSGELTLMVGTVCSGGRIDDNAVSINPRVVDSMVNSFMTAALSVEGCGWYSLPPVPPSLRERSTVE